MIKKWICNDYMTVPPIRIFCKNNGLRAVSNKEDGISLIEGYAECSPANKAQVLAWIDDVCKEGMKNCYIKKVEYSPVLVNEEYWNHIIEKSFEHSERAFLNSASFTGSMKIINISYQNNDIGVKKVYITLGKLVYDNSDLENVTEVRIPYPVFVTLDIENSIIEIRVKSKGKIYIKKEGNSEGEIRRERVTADKTILDVYNMLQRKFNFTENGLDNSRNDVFSCNYKVLAELAQTPDEILAKISGQEEKMKEICSDFFEKLSLDMRYYEQAKEDIKYFLEKYISLSEKNKNIFTNGKDGYPVKLISTDSEDTTLEETSSNREPLQTKASYFDHKKIFEREKVCDGMALAFFRGNTLYFGKEPFIVNMGYYHGFSVVKFTEYVEEGDIQNVLQRVIENL